MYRVVAIQTERRLKIELIKGNVIEAVKNMKAINYKVLFSSDNWKEAFDVSNALDEYQDMTMEFMKTGIHAEI
jgi:hypothetical protein